MAWCPRMVFLILIQFFLLHSVSSSSWQTLSGKPPLVIARGGFSGMFPYSSTQAYVLMNVTTSPDTTFWCDLQLTKDGVGFCFPSSNLKNGSDVDNYYPEKKQWLSADFTWKQLSRLFLLQNLDLRPYIFDSVSPIMTVEDVANLGTSGLWLNIQDPAFYKQHNLSMIDSVASLSKRMNVNFISSPDISFLKSVKTSVKPSVTKLIFRFLNQDQRDPSTNQSYGSLAKNLSYIKTFSSGIIVPKSYIWPIGSDLYLQPHTWLVTDAHKEGLLVFASEFANDFVMAYNYSYDSTAEYLSFIDNGNFSVDGFLSDFPVTPFRAINCFSHVNTKTAKKQANITIISKYGASGDYPGCTDLAYEKAVRDGVDILDCNVQMSKDKIPFCMSSIDLTNSTNVIETRFRNLSSIASEIDKNSGIYTFSLTMSQIQTLKPAIWNPFKDRLLYRNPKNKNAGKFVTLSDFLLLPTLYSSISGILIKVEHAAYLAEHQGISVVDAVLEELKKATTGEDQKSVRTLIQSTDKSVLMKFKEKKQGNHEDLVYRVEEDIRDVADSAIKDIKNFAGSVVISKKSVFPYTGVDGFVRPNTKTDVVRRLKSNGLRVYLETFSNEFSSQPFDFFSDPTMEIHTYVQDDHIPIDGIITDFPATTARYRENQCYSEMFMVTPGALIANTDTTGLPPAQAPYPLLAESDVMEPPLPGVIEGEKGPEGGEGSSTTPQKAEAKAIEVSFAVITMAMLVSSFISV